MPTIGPLPITTFRHVISHAAQRLSAEPRDLGLFTFFFSERIDQVVWTPGEKLSSHEHTVCPRSLHANIVIIHNDSLSVGSAEVIATSRIKPATSRMIICVGHVVYKLHSDKMHSDVLLRFERERRLPCPKVSVRLASVLALHVD